jgi:hypothetical protein
MISDRIKYLIDFCIGDGHLANYMYSSGTRNGQGSFVYKLTHCYKQREYLFHKIRILENLGFTGRLNEYKKSLNGKLFPMYEYTLHSDDDIKAAHKHIINKGRKAIDKHLLSILDARSLAYWYLDDGSSNKTNKSSSSPGNGFRYYYTYPIPKLSHFSLYTYSFTLEEHALIIEWLQNKFDIGATLVNAKRDGLYIKISELSERQKFINIIEQYVPVSMKYKIDGVLSYSGIEPIKIEKKFIIHGERPNDETPTDLSEEDAMAQDA